MLAKLGVQDPGKVSCFRVGSYWKFLKEVQLTVTVLNLENSSDWLLQGHLNLEISTDWLLQGHLNLEISTDWLLQGHLNLEISTDWLLQGVCITGQRKIGVNALSGCDYCV